MSIPFDDKAIELVRDIVCIKQYLVDFENDCAVKACIANGSDEKLAGLYFKNIAAFHHCLADKTAKFAQYFDTYTPHQIPEAYVHKPSC